MQAPKKRLLSPLIVLVVLIGILLAMRIPWRPPDNELISTTDWCPYFVKSLQAQSEAGIMGTFGIRSEPIFWGDYLIIERAAQVLRANFMIRENQSLKGIEHFTGLEWLEIDSMRLTHLDLSHNTRLKSVKIWAKELTALDVSNSPLLHSLDILSSNLRELDVSNNTRLARLIVGSSQITALDVSQNTNLRWLEILRSQLTGLDVSNNKLLRRLNVSYNNMHSPSDVVGWEELGLTLRREEGSGEGYFVFFPQNPSVR